MLVIAAVSFFSALCALTLWYVGFAQYNRRQGLRVLRWIESSLAGQGHVTGITWLTSSQFCVPLRLRSSVFQRPTVRVQLTPREMPFIWLRHRLRRENEKMTFEADLDNAPGIDVQIFNHRWCGRTRRKLTPDPKHWVFENVGPVLLSSRDEWRKELTGVMNAVLTSGERELYSVRVQTTSPHFAATVPLGSIAPTAEGRQQVFATLGELAAEASALPDSA